MNPHFPATKRLLLASLVSTSCLAAPAWALDLIDSYRAALEANAELKAARSAAEAGREAVPIALSQLLPNASLNYNHFRNDLSRRSLGLPNEPGQQYNSSSSTIVVRQPLYRPLAWAGYRRAQASVERAEATLHAAQQQIGMKVVKAYLDLLLARDTLLQLQTQMRVIGIQLQAAKSTLAAGQGTRTDIDEAQAQLDITAAKEVAARDGVDQARQELQTLTQKSAELLRPLDVDRLGLVVPEPDRLEDWWGLAEQRSPSIAALTADVQALRADVDRATAAHHPTLDLVAQHSVTDRDSIYDARSAYRNTQLGVSLTMPLYGGGGVRAQVRQSIAAMSQGEQKLEVELRKLRDEVQKTFQAVRQGILRVKAQEQAVRSQQQAVISNERGFAAGTRTRLDILQAQQQLSQTVLELARERYSYLLAHAQLQALSGSLDEQQVQKLNQPFASTAEVDVGSTKR